MFLENQNLIFIKKKKKIVFLENYLIWIKRLLLLQYEKYK